MVHKRVRFVLTACSVAPVCLTLAFMAYISAHYDALLVYILVALCSPVMAIIIVNYAIKESAETHINIDTIAPANKEVTNYFLTYLFPLFGGSDVFMDWRISLFFYLSLFFYIHFSESYYFNPLLSMLGYHFYEVGDKNGMTLLLVSKEVMLNANGVNVKVIRLSDYTYIAV